MHQKTIAKFESFVASCCSLNTSTWVWDETPKAGMHVFMLCMCVYLLRGLELLKFKFSKELQLATVNLKGN